MFKRKMFDNKYHFVRLSSCKYLHMHAKPLELHVAYFQKKKNNNNSICNTNVLGTNVKMTK